MTTISASHGSDTWTRSDYPNRNYASGNNIRLQQNHRHGFIHIPVTDIRGRTVLSATLTGHVRSGFVAQTVSVSAVTGSWSAGKVTWNREPAVGASVSTSLSALSDGAAASLDVTALMQSVANGTAFRGFRLATSASTADQSNWYAFDAPQAGWTLTVELSDAPEQPTNLHPNIGGVASAAPILSWSYTDLGGDSSEQGAFQVQVDPSANGTSPAFDTGWVTSSVPQYDLSSGTFTPLALHASTQWRVRTQDASGNVSLWSDWAPFAYWEYGTLVMDSPTGGTIGDSTPDILAHMTGRTLTQWRARVLDTADNVLWSSGMQDGAISITVPKRNAHGDKVISRDDTTYKIEVRAWDDVARADAVGYPAYVEQVTSVVFDESAGVTAPTGLTLAPAAPGDPRITFQWTSSLAPDGWLIIRDGVIHDRLDLADTSVSAGVYTWTDDGLADPYVQHNYTVRAVSSGARSAASNVVSYTSQIRDVWLVPDDGTQPIRLETKQSLDTFQVQDRTAVFKPLNSNTNTVIFYGYEGASGTFTGTLSWQQDQEAAVSRLADLRTNPIARPRLVWGVSIPVQVTNLKVLPAADYTAAQQVWNVSFDFIQAGD